MISSYSVWLDFWKQFSSYVYNGDAWVTSKKQQQTTERLGMIQIYIGLAIAQQNFTVLTNTTAILKSSSFLAYSKPHKLNKVRPQKKHEYPRSKRDIPF